MSVDAVTGKVDIPLTVDLDARDIYSSMQVKVSGWYTQLTDLTKFI